MAGNARQDTIWPPYLAYLAPYFSFLMLIEIENRAPAAAAPWFLALKVAVPFGLFAYYARCGLLPELRASRWTLGGSAADVGVGLASAALWVAPYLWLPALRPSAGEAFDPNLMGESLRWVSIGVRMLGFALVTPIVEELFIRSFLMRFADAVDKPLDFRQVEIARFSWRSFLMVVLIFTASHVRWEWPVAVAWIVLTNLWFYHRRQIAALIVVHAVANLSILLLAVFGSGRFRDGQGQLLSLWFFV